VTVLHGTAAILNAEILSVLISERTIILVTQLIGLWLHSTYFARQKPIAEKWVNACVVKIPKVVISVGYFQTVEFPNGKKVISLP